ncbi:MAG: diphthine--ammonia ligase, partial [Thermoplasmata archaeon]
YVSGILGIPSEFVSEKDFEKIFPKLRDEDYDALISGAVASEFQKTRIEKLCTEYDLVSYTPLWMIDQEVEVKEIIEAGIKAMIVSVSAEGLSEDDLGRELDLGYLDHLKHLHEKYGININGEGGEYETFVYGFGNHIYSIHGEKVWKGSGGYFIIEEIHS